MGLAFLKVAALVAGVMLANAPVGHAVPIMPAVAAGGYEVIAVAKKKRKHASSGRVLLGRVEDIDRREGRKAHAKRGGKLVGRVPTKRRTPRNDALDQFMGGLVGTMLGVGSNSGCAVDYTTPNPTGCGGRIVDRRGDNGLRPPYQCVVNGRTITTNTFRSGCWMLRQNNTRIPMR